MYDLHDTVAALATAPYGWRSIIRITGPQAVTVCGQLSTTDLTIEKNGIVHTTVAVHDDVTIEAVMYLFFAPHSYTGQDLVEIHVYVGQVLVQALVDRLLSVGVRAAGPGEFTARAYLNDKMDLSQAEAVNEVIMSSNHLQCAAAERLLAGHIIQKIQALNEQILEVLSLIEAGLDFCDQDISFITPAQALDRLHAIRQGLEEILTHHYPDDALMHLPSIGIAGIPNAGKSTLFNALIGSPRSIVSEQSQTTRDVLAASLRLGHVDCVLYDCAGLLAHPETLLDRLAQQAALEALQHSRLVLFCVDISQTDWHQDREILNPIPINRVQGVATKTDLIEAHTCKERLHRLTDRFRIPFVSVSAQTGQHIPLLIETLDKRLTGPRPTQPSEAAQEVAMLTARQHAQASEALSQVTDAIHELSQENDEIAALLLRAAYQALQQMERPVDERVLDMIFSRFCIGK